MSEVISNLLQFIQKYNNESYFIVLFLVSLVFLWLVEKNKNIRTTVIYLVTAIAVVILCPLYAWIGLKIDDEIYYRIFWTLPIGLLFCYSGVKLVIYFKGWLKKTVVVAIVLAVIILNGKLVYTNTIHFKATNGYHIPQIVIELADALRMDNYKPIVVLPDEFLPFYRQYSCDIYTPYGRNVLETGWIEKWGGVNKLHEAMSEDVYDTEVIAREARKENCVYVVLSGSKEQKGCMEEQNYILQGVAGGCYIYLDRYCYDVLKEQNLLDERHIIY